MPHRKTKQHGLQGVCLYELFVAFVRSSLWDKTLRAGVLRDGAVVLARGGKSATRVSMMHAAVVIRRPCANTFGQ